MVYLSQNEIDADHVKTVPVSLLLNRLQNSGSVCIR